MPVAISAKLKVGGGLQVCGETFFDAPATGSYVVAKPQWSSLALTVCETLSDVESDWRAFEQHADCTVFQTFDWLSTWQLHVGARTGIRPAIVIGRNDSGEILFILPLAIRPLGFSRELVWLGSELCDYNAPLLAAHFSACMDSAQFRRLWRLITQRLKSHSRLQYDFVRLEKMPATIGGQPNPILALGVMLNPSGAYFTPLKGNWDAFYAANRSSSSRSRDRTKRRRLAEIGDLSFLHRETASDRLATLDTLMAQKSLSFDRMGVSNLFARPGNLDFYRALITDPQSRALVHMSQFNCGSLAAAANLGLTFRGCYYHHLASHADGNMSRFGPGAAHLHDLLRYAIDRGFKIFDFTIGDERYKRDWCDGAQKLFDHLSITTWRGALLYTPIFASNWLKRMIKQTPVLWKAFTRSRAFYGAVCNRKKIEK
jgi:CelD/BcsL family acetyltransferase involved in cellulose biosynthesis